MGRPWMTTDSPITQNTFHKKNMSRARETTLFFRPPFFELRSMCQMVNFALQLHAPTSVSSTRNVHFQQTALSNTRLAYAKHTFPKSSVVSSTRDATFFDKLPSRLRETPTLGGKAEPSPAEPSRAEPIRAEQKSTTQNKVASRLREMLFFPDFTI